MLIYYKTHVCFKFGRLNFKLAIFHLTTKINISRGSEGKIGISIGEGGGGYILCPDFGKSRGHGGGGVKCKIPSVGRYGYFLEPHIITFPQGYIGALRSKSNKTKHQILIKHKFV